MARKRTVKLALVVFVGSVFGSGIVGCGGNDEPRPVTVAYYQPAYRQTPPEPVYSRITWSHLPQPMRTKVKENAPILMPTISFELPNSSLQEAIEALAQTIGYNWHYPQSAANRKVRIKMVGSVEDVLHEIARQTQVEAVLDHEARMVRVDDGISIAPQLSLSSTTR